MSMNTHLRGRLRNTPLRPSNALFCLFEVVNSIQAISERNAATAFGRITIEILRIPQAALQLRYKKSKQGSPTPRTGWLRGVFNWSWGISSGTESQPLINGKR